jgi:hypothetical protein
VYAVQTTLWMYLEAGVLDKFVSAKLAQRRSFNRPARLHRLDTVPAWWACTATPLSEVS